MKDCQGLWGRLFGHDYRPVFDVGPAHPRPLDGVKLEGFGADMAIKDVLNANIKRTYIKHVCIRCGATAEAKE